MDLIGAGHNLLSSQLMSNINLVVADDHNILRSGLRALLACEADFNIVGEATSGREAVTLARELSPNVVVMDLAMPLLNGMEATRQIVETCPDVKVIVLSAYDDDEHLESALAAGAAGYLLKHTAMDDLIEAVRQVHQGNAYFSPTIARRLSEKQLAGLHRPKEKATRPNPLTSRETEVLQLIAEGFVNKQIAAELNRSVKTIEKHRQSLMRRLDVHCTADLVQYAVSKGVIELRSVKNIFNPIDRQTSPMRTSDK
jgi:DNA-binding NarL/FixJ family response regulator